MAYAKDAGISTLGVKVGYAIETTPGVMPTDNYIWLERANSIGGISLDTEQIDASALEDEISRYVAGRQDTGGTWTITFNIGDDVVTLLEKMISDYKTGIEDNKKAWFTVWSPFMENAFYIKAQPPLHIPMSEMGQNALQTIELTFTIEDYAGMKKASEPKEYNP